MTAHKHQDRRGRTLNAGRYRIGRLLAEGSLGDVYEGIDTNFDTGVAIKIIHAALVQDRNFVARFTQTLRAAVRLSHPGIVRVFDFGASDGDFYVITEIVGGQDLAHRFAELRAAKRWMGLDEAFYIVRHVAQALDYAHVHGLQRRRVDPTHVMLRPMEAPTPADRFPYEPVIVDLGVEELGFATQHQDSTAMLPYLAPEAVLGEPTNELSDLYTLGLLTWELALGRPMFQAETIAEAVDFYLNQPLPEAAALHPALPKQVTDLLERTLARAPHERFPSVRDFLSRVAALPPSLLEGIHPPIYLVEQPAQPKMDAALPAPTPGGPALQSPRPAGMRPAAPSPLSGPDTGVSSGTYSTALPRKRLHIQTRKGEQIVELTGSEITIGRMVGNKVVIEDPRISRRHARIDLTSGKIHIVDLGSANGTFLGGNRLVPQQSVEWKDHLLVHMGDAVLRIVTEQPQAIPGEAIAPEKQGSPRVYLHAFEEHIERSRILTSADGTSVGLFIKQAEGAVEPGRQLMVSFVLLNPKNTADHFVINVTGVPPDWCRLATNNLYLGPGEQRLVELILSPARSPETRASVYPLRIIARSQQMTGQAAVLEFRLTVKPFGHVHAELQPTTVQAGRPLRVALRNDGNAPRTVTLIWWDEMRELVFQPDRDEVVVHPGESKFVEFIAQPRKIGWFSGTKKHIVTVQVHPQYDQIQKIFGEVISRGRIPIR